jgi:hypothetical protein
VKVSSYFNNRHKVRKSNVMEQIAISKRRSIRMIKGAGILMNGGVSPDIGRLDEQPTSLSFVQTAKLLPLS